MPEFHDKSVALTGYADCIAVHHGAGLMVARARERSCEAIYRHNAEGFGHQVAQSQYGNEHRNIIVVDEANRVKHPRFVRNLKKWATKNNFSFSPSYWDEMTNKLQEHRIPDTRNRVEIVTD